MPNKVWLNNRFNINLPLWTLMVPVLAIGLLVVQLLVHPTGIVANSVTAMMLIGAVFAAVHHAEVIAHKVGEPFGTLILALAVTVIEVALIIALMNSSNPADRAILARDTVYAAVMVVNGIMGLALLIGGLRNYVQDFELEGVNKAVSVLLVLGLIVFMLPNFTLSLPGAQMLTSQAIFVAFSCVVSYASFIFTQTIRHRNYFTADGTDDGHHSDNTRTTLTSSVVMLVSLIAVVGLAKMLSPVIESGLSNLGLPKVVLGIVIASLVLLPESIAAIKAAYNNQLQNSLNLALGSALASISLTIPVIVAYTVWSGDKLILGLSSKDAAMLFITLLLISNTLKTGKSTFLLGVLHLVVFASFIFFSIIP